MVPQDLESDLLAGWALVTARFESPLAEEGDDDDADRGWQLLVPGQIEQVQKLAPTHRLLHPTQTKP